MPGSGPKPITFVLIIASALGLYLIGNGSVSLWDRDEPRYAQASREMLHKGDWVVPRLYDAPRTAKPPLIYWVQATAMRLFGDNAWAARLPSALAMALTLAALAAILYHYVDPDRALWTLVVLASSTMTIVAAKTCLTDSVLLVFITLGQICFYEIWRGRASWWIIVSFGVLVGLAGLTKGPVVLGVHAMTLLALLALRWVDRRSAKTTRASDETLGSPAAPVFDYASPQFPAGRKADAIVRGIAKAFVWLLVVAAVVLPWLLLIHQRSPAFLEKSLQRDVLKRIQSGLEGHSAPPGYHLLTVWATFLPWSLLLPLALVLGWKHRREPMVRFALAAVAGPWLMFEIVRTKLPHYLLPVFPPLAFLTADAIVRSLRGVRDDLRQPGFLRAAAAWAIVAVCIGLGPWIFRIWFDELPWGGMLLMSVAAFAWAAIVFRLFYLRRPAQALASIAGGMAVVTILIFTVYLPHAQFLRLSMRVANVLRSEGATGPGESIMLDYKEPSLAFYQGGTIREDRATALPEELPERWPRWIVVTGDVWAKASEHTRSQLEPVGPPFKGLAYADGGRIIEVLVLRRKPPTQATALQGPDRTR